MSLAPCFNNRLSMLSANRCQVDQRKFALTSDKVPYRVTARRVNEFIQTCFETFLGATSISPALPTVHAEGLIGRSTITTLGSRDCIQFRAAPHGPSTAGTAHEATVTRETSQIKWQRLVPCVGSEIPASHLN